MNLSLFFCFLILCFIWLFFNTLMLNIFLFYRYNMFYLLIFIVPN